MYKSERNMKWNTLIGVCRMLSYVFDIPYSGFKSGVFCRPHILKLLNNVLKYRNSVFVSLNHVFIMET